MLNFKGDLLPVMAELCQHDFEVTLVDCLDGKDLQFLIMVGLLLGLGIKEGGQSARVHCLLEVRVKLLHLVSDLFLLALHNLRVYLQAFSLERNKFTAKSEPGTALGMIPLGSVGCAIRLYLGSSEVNLLLGH